MDNLVFQTLIAKNKTKYLQMTTTKSTQKLTQSKKNRRSTSQIQKKFKQIQVISNDIEALYNNSLNKAIQLNTMIDKYEGVNKKYNQISQKLSISQQKWEKDQTLEIYNDKLEQSIVFFSQQKQITSNRLQKLKQAKAILQNKIAALGQQTQLKQSQYHNIYYDLQNLQDQTEQVRNVLNLSQSGVQAAELSCIQNAHQLLISRQQILTLKNKINIEYNYYLNSEEEFQRSDKDDRLFYSQYSTKIEFRNQIIIDIVYYLITQTNLKSSTFLKANTLSPSLTRLYSKLILLESDNFQIVQNYLNNQKIEKGKYNIKRNISVIIREQGLQLIYQAWQILLRYSRGKLRCREVNTTQILLENEQEELIMIRINPTKATKRVLTINIK